MYRKEINARSPMRILEASLHGGLGRGNLGVIMARAGVGKTTCLVQIALDDLMRRRRVLHIGLGVPAVDDVLRWYRALFDDIAAEFTLDDRDEATQIIADHRMIESHADALLTPALLRRQLGLYDKHLGFVPDAIIIDDFDWSGKKDVTGTCLAGLKECAKRSNADLWMTAQIRRDETGLQPTRVSPPCEAYLDLIDVALLLEPREDHVSLRLLKDHDDLDPQDTALSLAPNTMRLIASTDEAAGEALLRPNAYTLLSGAAPGSESAFGACAERYGVAEVNFSFSGRSVERSRGLVLLADTELQEGAVSNRYVTRTLNRTFPDTPHFRRVLRSIWHQVNTSGEVFFVGRVQDDGTVRGGTGWAAELAKLQKTPLHVYDQESCSWMRWDDGAWTIESCPRISARRFTGTGTKHLTDEGRRAIEELFARSFGSAS